MTIHEEIINQELIDVITQSEKHVIPEPVKTKLGFHIILICENRDRIEIKKQKGELFIGLPKETLFEEKRICLTPDAVSALTSHGHRIVIEAGAGEGSNYSDNEYSEAGAKISYDTKEVFSCNIVLKVAPPTIDEIAMITPQSVLISALQLKTQTNSKND